jgi:predicted acetyltransferase
LGIELDGPRVVKENEFDELLALVDQTFFGGQFRGLQSSWPTVYGYNVRQLDNHTVIAEDGKLVSHLAMVSKELIISGCMLNIRGVGGVSTLEHYRNRGFASVLIRDSIEKMREDGTDIAFLLGLRHRYGRWGWEVGGQIVEYTVTERSMPFFGTHKGKVWRYMGSSEDIDAIAEVHDTDLFGLKRQKSAYAMLLAISSIQTWLCRLNDGGFAYIVLKGNGDVRSALEIGGNTRAIATLVKTVMLELRVKSLSISSPAEVADTTCLLKTVASEWHMVPAGRINILNLYSTLVKLQSYLEQRIAAFHVPIEIDIGICMRSSWDNREEKVTIHLGDNIQVCRGCKDGIVLDQRDVVHLLFGLNRPTRILKLPARIGAVLDLLFPVPFYVSGLDYIDLG